MDHLPEYMGEGLIGLSKRDSNIEKEPTLVEALYSNGMISEASFSLLLTTRECEKNSLLTLGGFKQEYFRKEMHFVSSKNKEFWDIGFNKSMVKMGSREFELHFLSNQLMLDSGTTKITFSKQNMNILIDKFVREFAIECDFVKNGLEDLECSEVDVN